jgi:hypothetical protein
MKRTIPLIYPPSPMEAITAAERNPFVDKLATFRYGSKTAMIA